MKNNERLAFEVAGFIWGVLMTYFIMSI